MSLEKWSERCVVTQPDETRVLIKFTAFRLPYLLAAWNSSLVRISFNDVEYCSDSGSEYAQFPEEIVGL